MPRSIGSLGEGAAQIARRSPVAAVALVVALAGTGWAASKAGPNDIAPNAIRSKHIAPAKVKRGELRNQSVGTVLGTGVLGGMIRDFEVGVGFSSAGEAVATIGTGGLPTDDFGLIAPRPMTLRDLHVETVNGVSLPAGRHVFLSLERSPGSDVLTCTIPDGGTVCDTGNKKLKLDAGDRYRAFFEGVGDSTVELSGINFLFGYREAP